MNLNSFYEQPMDVNFSQNSLKEWLNFVWKGGWVGVEKQLAVWKKIFWFSDSVWNQTQALMWFSIDWPAHSSHTPTNTTPRDLNSLLNSPHLSIIHFLVKNIFKVHFDKWSLSRKGKHLIMILTKFVCLKSHFCFVENAILEVNI